MGKRRKGGNNARDATQGNKGSAVGIYLHNGNDAICIPGYTRLSDNPEVIMAVNKIASLIGSMTIHLMTNSEQGDLRIKNELSRQVDITPNRYMSRKTLMEWIIQTLLLYGSGNAVVMPTTHNGYLGDLVPIPYNRVSFAPQGNFGYIVQIDGQAYDPGSLLHFSINPDPIYPWRGTGFRVALKDVVSNLKQAAATQKGFMESKWKPSVIVMVNSDADELATPTGRDNLLQQYMDNSEAGKPWLIPADLMTVEQVRPLSLNDLAINDTVALDKKTVAAILGVPPWVVGAGGFSRDEWNAFVNTTVLPIVRGIEQELTRKLLFSDKMFWRLNPWSLYSYDIGTLANVGSELYVRGLMTGNEVRDWIGQGPKPGLDELVILENYIPLDRIADQAKLVGTDTSESGGGDSG